MVDRLESPSLLRIRYGSEDDVGAGAPSRRRPTARGRAVSTANALSRLRQGYGEPGDNAFTLAILSDDAAFVPLSKNGSARK